MTSGRMKEGAEGVDGHVFRVGEIECLISARVTMSCPIFAPLPLCYGRTTSRD
jgi:hypothetical protein